jgi:uncharacterized protein RhaS with RHS repeats
MYKPEIGRFLQTDPLGYIDTINPYAYCANNPLNRVDPWGLYAYNPGGAGFPTPMIDTSTGCPINGGTNSGLPPKLYTKVVVGSLLGAAGWYVAGPMGAALVGGSAELIGGLMDIIYEIAE